MSPTAEPGDGLDAPEPEPGAIVWLAVSGAFAALGRALICLDSHFHVMHASKLLDELLGPGASDRLEGLPVAELVGPELFGPRGALALALRAGERREGWRVTFATSTGERRIGSISVAPVSAIRASLPAGACDTQVEYMVVLRPADSDPATAAGSPTTFAGMIARSAAMTRVFALIDNLRDSDATVLLTGESGTGKELLARALHARSHRAKGPFVAVNCGAVPAELLESEMFGAVKGAFTGAVRDREGRFEAASGGTLFLDEIGDMPLALQVKLLRVLQDHRFERLGETRTRSVDIRVVAATHVELRAAVAAGRFREDLFYRLRVVPIDVPPLRERREDIEPLARQLLASVAERQGRSVRLSPDALRAILRHAWPGNVRELENALEYAVAVCRGQTILEDDLPVEVAGLAPAAASEPQQTEPAAEAIRLREVLEQYRWKRGAAARALGISRTTLWRRMREAGLAKPT